MSILYFIISFFSSVVGAISGIGGGVIIKPVLDNISSYDAGVISFLSGNTVLVMTAIALFRNRGSEIKLNRKVSFLLALGGMIGGLAGKSLFDLTCSYYGSAQMLGKIQSVILAILCLFVLLFTLIKHKIPSFNMERYSSCLMSGFLLGGLASYLGIGGGPINLAVLYLLFSMDSKTAAHNSLFIIFISQLTNLIFTLVSGNVPSFPHIFLALMVTGGFIGGLTGSQLSRKMSNRHVDYLFITVLFIIAVISSVNFFSYTNIVS